MQELLFCKYTIKEGEYKLSNYEKHYEACCTLDMAS